eukprot:418660-Prymnesium_polylepis.1
MQSRRRRGCEDAPSSCDRARGVYNGRVSEDEGGDVHRARGVNHHMPGVNPEARARLHGRWRR